MTAHLIFIIRGFRRLEDKLRFQLGTRPLVFFAPKAFSGVLTGGSGRVKAIFGNRSRRVDGGTRCPGGSAS